MKKKIATTLAAGALLLSTVTVFAVRPENTPNNGNSHNKTTGTVTWTARTHLPPNQQLPGIVSIFDVHDEAPGAESDRGTHEITRPADSSFPGGSLSLDVECVSIGGNQAWFAGTVSWATGGYSGLEGDAFLYWVKDEATPGSAGDKIGGRGYNNINAACGAVEAHSWTGTGVVTDGNLVVH